jgi:hypothetical protein
MPLRASGAEKMAVKDAPRLQRFGDKTEQQYWVRLRKRIPHYEDFWQLYVLPLRALGSIWFREDIDEKWETIAIASYSTFSALGRAYEQVQTNKDRFRHIAEVYMAIQRSAELGVKLVNAFASVNGGPLLSANSSVASELEEFIENRLSKYRNLLHDVILPMPKAERRRMIPKPDRIDEYRLWTRVMYHYNEEDFISASEQMKNDFEATCSRLEDAWEAMCLRRDSLSRGESPLIVNVSKLALLTMPAGSMVGGPPASGDIYLGSDSDRLKPARRFQVRQAAKPVHRGKHR